MFHISVINIMKNDESMIKWIESIQLNYLKTGKLNSDKYILTLPKKYIKKIHTLSNKHNIPKTNLIPILLYHIVKSSPNQFYYTFVKHMTLLNKVYID